MKKSTEITLNILLGFVRIQEIFLGFYMMLSSYMNLLIVISRTLKEVMFLLVLMIIAFQKEMIIMAIMFFLQTKRQGMIYVHCMKQSCWRNDRSSLDEIAIVNVISQR